MNIQQGNSFGNNSVNHNGQYFGNTYQINGEVNINYHGNKKAPSSDNLYEGGKTPNIIVRWIVAVSKLGTDVVLTRDALRDGLLQKWFTAIFQPSSDPTATTMMLLCVQMLCVLVSLLLTAYLVMGAYKLTKKKWYFSLRRIGLSVYYIKTRKCKICGSKTSIRYNQGNQIVCKQEPNAHKWSVWFPQK